mmetsp:Transcript_7156/g.17170  ORF Transcript_7156/g.17170 Transcript_7156/m.17170 type:complete len:206 (+) Transcript_7156:2717-3334(+)
MLTSLSKNSFSAHFDDKPGNLPEQASRSMAERCWLTTRPPSKRLPPFEAPTHRGSSGAPSRSTNSRLASRLHTSKPAQDTHVACWGVLAVARSRRRAPLCAAALSTPKVKLYVPVIREVMAMQTSRCPSSPTGPTIFSRNSCVSARDRANCCAAAMPSLIELAVLLSAPSSSACCSIDISSLACTCSRSSMRSWLELRCSDTITP